MYILDSYSDWSFIKFITSVNFQPLQDSYSRSSALNYSHRLRCISCSTLTTLLLYCIIKFYLLILLTFKSKIQVDCNFQVNNFVFDLLECFLTKWSVISVKKVYTSNSLLEGKNGSIYWTIWFGLVVNCIRCQWGKKIIKLT